MMQRPRAALDGGVMRHSWRQVRSAIERGLGVVLLSLPLVALSGCNDDAPRSRSVPSIDESLEGGSRRPIAELLHLGPANAAGESDALSDSTAFRPTTTAAGNASKQSEAGMPAGPATVRDGSPFVESSVSSSPASVAILGNDPLQAAVPKSLKDSSELSLSSERWAYLRNSERPQDVLLRTAFQQLSTGKLDEAILTAEQLRNADPKNARAYEILGAVYSSRGEFDRALNYYDLAISFDPKNPGLYLQRGTIYARQKWTVRALDDLSKVIELEPKNLAAYLWRSMACLNGAKFQQSAADASYVLQQNDKVPDAYFLRCVARLQMGRLEPAREDYWAAVKLGLDPNARSAVQKVFEPDAPAKPQ